MVRLIDKPTTDQDQVTPANGDVASCLATRELNLSGPCVVSGVQSHHAEELVFVRSGNAEIWDGEGNVFSGRDCCVSLARGQRYRLQVNAGDTAKLLILTVPELDDPKNREILQIAKARVRDMILNEQRHYSSFMPKR